MSDEIFGTANLDNGPGYERWRLSAKRLRTISLRILPPMKSCREDGKWALYFGVVFGWNGVGKDPARPRYRPFLSIEERDFRTGMTTFQSDVDRLISEKNTEMKQRKAVLTSQGVSDRQDDLCRDPEYKQLFDWCNRYSVTRSWHILALDENGKPGILQLNNKAKKNLQACIEKLVSAGENPLGVENGIYLTFTRHGNGFEIPDTVEPTVVHETVNGKRMQTYKYHTITPDVGRTCARVLPDLIELRESFRLPLEALTEMAASSGDPVEVDAIWDRYRPNSKQSHQQAPVVAKTPVPAPAPAPVPAPVQVATEEDNDAELAALEAQIAAKRAAMQQKKPAIPVAANVVKPQPVATSEAPEASGGDWNPEEDLSDIFG